jgi:hypothetical protein
MRKDGAEGGGGVWQKEARKLITRGMMARRRRRAGGIGKALRNPLPSMWSPKHIENPTKNTLDLAIGLD